MRFEMVWTCVTGKNRVGLDSVSDIEQADAADEVGVGNTCELPIHLHTSDAFQARLKEWEDRGLYVYLLPAYSPELNLIEILWRRIKYDWLPLDAYDSYKDLLRALGNVLKEVGSKYQINFAH